MSLLTSPLICFLLLSVVAAACHGESGSPIVKVYAYQREIVAGVPGPAQGKGTDSSKKQYSIYLVTSPATKFQVVGAWINGTEYSVKSVVKPSPVRFDNPVVFEQEERNIAVPKTENQITEIILKTPMPDKALDKAAAQLLKQNQAIVELTSGGKTIWVPIKAFKKRDPVFLR